MPKDSALTKHVIYDFLPILSNGYEHLLPIANGIAHEVLHEVVRSDMNNERQYIEIKHIIGYAFPWPQHVPDAGALFLVGQSLKLFRG